MDSDSGLSDSDLSDSGLSVDSGFLSMTADLADIVDTWLSRLDWVRDHDREKLMAKY